MSGIADLHMLTALQNGWKQIMSGKDDADPYAGVGYTNFKRMFPNISDAMLREWWTACVNKPLSFRAHAATGHDDFPVIIVQLLSESKTESPMGHFGGSSDNRDVHSMIVQQTVLVTIMGNNAEVVRALFVVIRDIMLSYQKLFLKAGYLECSYGGAEEMTPEEELIADDMGVFVRKQRYDTISQVNAYPLDADAITGVSWFVQTEDITTSPDQNASTGRVSDSDGVGGAVIEHE